MEMAYRERWKAEIAAMRRVLAGLAMKEECKWGKPTYTVDGKNIVIMQGFKDYFGLGFFQGTLLKDPKKVLVQLGQVHAGRVMKFTSAKDITAKAATITAYVREAIAVEKAGLRMKPKRTSDFPVPQELRRRFRRDPRFKHAFEALAIAALRVNQPHETGDRRNQFRRFHWLRQVCLVSSAKRAGAIFGPCIGGEGDGGNRPAVLGAQSPHLLHQVVAVHIRQPDVAHEDVSLASSQFGERFGGATDSRNVCSGGGQETLEKLTCVWLILDDQHPNPLQRRWRWGVVRFRIQRLDIGRLYAGARW